MERGRGSKRDLCSVDGYKVIDETHIMTIISIFHTYTCFWYDTFASNDPHSVYGITKVMQKKMNAKRVFFLFFLKKKWHREYVYVVAIETTDCARDTW